MAWNLTLDDGIEVHAEALWRRLRGRAPRYAEDRALELESHNDAEGARVWRKVRFSIERRVFAATDC